MPQCACVDINSSPKYYIHVQGNSMATQSEETGSTAAMMDIDSMSSQVRIENINMFTTSGV